MALICPQLLPPLARGYLVIIDFFGHYWSFSSQAQIHLNNTTEYSLLSKDWIISKDP